jgi:hypothetical protein
MFADARKRFARASDTKDMVVVECYWICELNLSCAQYGIMLVSFLPRAFYFIPPGASCAVSYFASSLPLQQATSCDVDVGSYDHYDDTRGEKW